jgi:hypothetical protein
VCWNYPKVVTKIYRPRDSSFVPENAVRWLSDDSFIAESSPASTPDVSPNGEARKKPTTVSRQHPRHAEKMRAKVVCPAQPGWRLNIGFQGSRVWCVSEPPPQTTDRVVQSHDWRG